MSALTGLPDFARPVGADKAAAYLAYAAYEQPGVLAVLPSGLEPAPLDTGSGPIRVDVYLQERDAEIAEFAIVTAGFAVSSADPSAADPSTVVHRPAPLGDGLLVLTAPDDLALPAESLAPQPFEAASGRSVPTLLRLEPVATEILLGALYSGLQTLGAVVQMTVRGLAVRCAGTMEADLDTVLGDLSGSTWTAAALHQRVLDGIPGVRVSGGPGDAQLLGTAVVDRLVTRLAEPAPLTDAGLEGGWRFPAPTGQPTRATWDLDEPALVRRALRLACDPVRGPVDPSDVVRRHTAAPLTDGRQRVTVHTTIPSPPAGVKAAAARLVAAPAPPDRPFEAEVTALLQPPAPTEVTLILAPGEPLGFDLVGSSIVDTSSGPRELRGTPRHVTDSSPVVTPADLGLRLISVQATETLLARADVVVHAIAVYEGDTVRASTQLRTGARQSWLALPRAAESVRMTAEATTRDSEPVTVSVDLPDEAVWLDPFSFADPPWPLPGQGAQPQPPIAVEAAGLRLVGRPGGSEWRFVPLTAAPVRDEAGNPQLSLLEAGGVAALMVTVGLRVSDAQQDEAREACIQAGAAPDVRLSPGPTEVQEAVLLVMRGESLATVATANPSGTATQDAAFAATLTAADVATVRSALDGEPGLVAVRYVLAVSATGPEASLLQGGTGPVIALTDASTWRT